MENKRYCYGCFRELSGEVCPYCGFRPTTESRPTIALPIGAILNGRYLVGKVLGIGGFGITYLALDLILEQKVAIKEYMPTGIATRESDRYTVSAVSAKEIASFESGESKFLEEARILAKLKDTEHIVSVYNFFKENGSAYFAMEYVDGLSLKDYLKQQGGHISIENALTILLPVMNALGEVHAQGLLHRDISPDNIYITDKGESMLLDFGAARFALSNDKSFSVILKQGFAPEEQYRTHGNQGPWTDVYAISATIYYAISGVLPPDALERVHHDNLIPPSQLGCKIKARTEAALLKGLAVKADDRFPNMSSFVLALVGTQSESNAIIMPPYTAEEGLAYGVGGTSGSGEIFVADNATGKGANNVLAKLRDKRNWPWLGAGIAVVLLAIILPLSLSGGKKHKETPGGVGGNNQNVIANIQKETTEATAAGISPTGTAFKPETDTPNSSVPDTTAFEPEDTTPGSSVTTVPITDTAAENTELKLLRNDALGIQISLPSDLSIDNSDSLSYFIANRANYTTVACSFAYACGAPMYNLEDFQQNIAEILPYTLDYFYLDVIPSLQKTESVMLGSIPAIKADFTCAGNTAEWSLYGFAPSSGPGCYFLLVGQDTKDPDYIAHKEQLENCLSGLTLFAVPQSDQVIVEAQTANMQMVYDSYYAIPTGIENDELFHMYFDESQFSTGSASINVFDISDKASTIEDAVLFLNDQFQAFATVSGEPQGTDIYTLGKKQICSIFLDFTYNDDVDEKLMHGTIHVVQLGSRIFALEGFYDETNTDVVSKQLDLIGVSLDTKH